MPLRMPRRYNENEKYDSIVVNTAYHQPNMVHSASSICRSCSAPLSLELGGTVALLHRPVPVIVQQALAHVRPVKLVSHLPVVVPGPNPGNDEELGNDE